MCTIEFYTKIQKSAACLLELQYISIPVDCTLLTYKNAMCNEVKNFPLKALFSNINNNVG